MHNAVENRLSDSLCGFWTILLNVPNGGFELGGSLSCPPDTPHGSNNRLMRFTTSA